MKLKVLITILTLLFSSDVHACKYMFSDNFAKESIENAYYIGLVKIVDFEKKENGRPYRVELRPFMTYKAAEDFKPDQNMTINEAGFNLTSCGKMLRLESDIQEVVIFKKDEVLKLGDLMESDLRHYWEELRTKASYASKK